MMVSFKREFALEDSLRCFEILMSRHLELTSHVAETVTQQEKTQVFMNKGNSFKLKPVSSTNPEFFAY